MSTNKAQTIKTNNNSRPPVAGSTDRLVRSMSTARVWFAIVGLVMTGLILLYVAYRAMFGKIEDTEDPKKSRTNGMIFAVLAVVAFVLAYVFYRYRNSETLAGFLFVSNIVN